MQLENDYILVDFHTGIQMIIKLVGVITCLDTNDDTAIHFQKIW